MHIVIFITVGSANEAAEIARALIGERLAACANIVDHVKSIYRWKEEVEEASEVLLLIKSTDDRLNDLIARVRQLHSYKNPEVIAIKVEDGSSEYLDWVSSSVKHQ